MFTPGGAESEGSRGAIHGGAARHGQELAATADQPVTAYLAPGHSASSTSFLFDVREGGRDYRVFEFCCWELPSELNRNSYINEASMRHTFATFRKVLPVDIYLEGGTYAWSGILNQRSGTLQERMEKLKTNHLLFANRDIFQDRAAWREVEFADKVADLKNAGTVPVYR